MILKKVCLLGDFAVGKTSLMHRFVDRQFSDEYLSTVGVKISRKLLQLKKGTATKELQLILWDLEGHSLLRSTSPDHLRGAHAAIIVGDLSREASMESMSAHAETFLTLNPEATIVFARNKSDLAPGAVTLDFSLSNLQQFPSFATSAKTGECVDEMFSALGNILLNGTNV